MSESLFSVADVERLILDARRELWVKDPPLSLPVEQSTGWNNALVALERRVQEKLRG